MCRVNKGLLCHVCLVWFYCYVWFAVSIDKIPQYENGKLSKNINFKIRNLPAIAPIGSKAPNTVVPE